MEIFEAVTPDGKESDINKVKVRRTVAVSKETAFEIKEMLPNFTLPQPEMYRLEVIDKELDALVEQRDNILAEIAAKEVLRGKVKRAALTVELILK